MVQLAYKPTNNSKMPKSNNKNAPNIWGAFRFVWIVKLRTIMKRMKVLSR